MTLASITIESSSLRFSGSKSINPLSIIYSISVIAALVSNSSPLGRIIPSVSTFIVMLSIPKLDNSEPVLDILYRSESSPLLLVPSSSLLSSSPLLSGVPPSSKLAVKSNDSIVGIGNRSPEESGSKSAPIDSSRGLSPFSTGSNSLSKSTVEPKTSNSKSSIAPTNVPLSFAVLNTSLSFCVNKSKL